MILYLIAMDSEAKDIINSFELVQETPFKLYKNNKSLLAITGIGKTNASFVTSFMLATNKISKIINLGFVGAYGDFNIGDLLIVKEAKYHDFDLQIFNYDLGQVPGLPTIYSTKSEDLFHFLNLNQVRLYTGDYFMTKPIELNCIADMEATAIYQVGYRLNVDVISLKVVSDVIGKESHISDYNDFELNGSRKVKDLYERCASIYE